MDFGIANTELLKLHGSISWHVKRGTQRPYPVDAIVHFEPWLERSNPAGGSSPIGEDQYSAWQSSAELYLETEPFIIPPVMNKSTFADYPLLENVWARAFERLKNAENVIFIGYSFPITDNLTAYLFEETLIRDIEAIRDRDPLPKLQIVNWVDLNATDRAAKEQGIKAAYRAIFPDLDDSQFRFDGALEWAKEFIQS